MFARLTERMLDRSWILLALVFLCPIGLTGCGDDRPRLVEVTGRVTFKGEPLTAGSIHFHPDSANSFQKDSPSSLLQLDGSFNVKTFPYGDGVPLGTYKVTLSPQLCARIELPIYGDVAQTPWTIEVTETGVKGHVFEVK